MEEIKKISIDDKNFPELLKEIKNAPKILYYIGELKREENCIAMVGTRRYSSYGKQIALEMAGDLAESGLTVVSGLAPGIDTFCHEAVVERKNAQLQFWELALIEKLSIPNQI